MMAWVFHSPRRALAVLAAVLAFTGLGLMVASRGHDEPARPVAPPALTAAAASAAAKAWIDARMVLQHDQTPAEWLAAVAALSTPQMLPGLSQVDPTQLPQTGVYGSPTVRTLGEASAEVAVPVVGGGTVIVRVVIWDGRPLVDGAHLPTLPTVTDL